MSHLPNGAYQIRVAGQIPVHLRSGGAPFGDGPHHQGLAPAHIASGEHLVRIGSIAPRRCADRPVCLHTEGLAHAPLTPGKAGGADQQLAGQGIPLRGDHTGQGTAFPRHQALDLDAEPPGIPGP